MIVMWLFCGCKYVYFEHD